MGEINIVPAGTPLAAALGAPVGRTIGLRPESARLGSDGIAATVKRATYLGSKTELEVATTTGESLKLWTRATPTAGSSLHFRVAEEDLISL